MKENLKVEKINDLVDDLYEKVAYISLIYDFTSQDALELEVLIDKIKIINNDLD